MQPTGATFDSFRQPPGVSAAKGAWAHPAAHAGYAGHYDQRETGPRRKNHILGIALVTGTSALGWIALFAVSGLM